MLGTILEVGKQTEMCSYSMKSRVEMTVDYISPTVLCHLRPPNFYPGEVFVLGCECCS